MQERLNFKIVLDSVFWNKIPEVEVILNKTVVDRRVVSTETTIEFQKDLEKDSDHTLEIRLTNKENSDVIVENGNIVKDMVLKIKEVKIDDVYISNVLREKTKYFLDVPYQDENGNLFDAFQNCFDLGWTGNWVFHFQTPYYVWLLENT